MDPNVLKTVLDFGGFGALTIIIFLAYDRRMKEHGTILRELSQVIQRQCDLASNGGDALKEHDRKVTDAVATIQRIDSTTQRTAQVVDALHARQQVRQQ